MDLCSRLPASGLLRPEARWPDKVLFSAEKSGALRASGLRAGLGTALVPPAEPFGLRPLRGKWPAGRVGTVFVTDCFEMEGFLWGWI